MHKSYDFGVCHLSESRQMAKRDYYEVLGVAKRPIGRAQEGLSPFGDEVSSDRNPDNKEAEEKFKEQTKLMKFSLMLISVPP